MLAINEQLEIAYLAGFFDGEGCILIAKTKTKLGRASYELRIGATQVDTRPILLLEQQFGGLVRKRTYKNQPKWNDQYTWNQVSQKAAYTLKLLLPYLVVKYDQAVFALEFANVCSTYHAKVKTEEDLIWFEEQKRILSKMKGRL